MKRPRDTGFTLLEVLLVVAAIGILAGIVIIAVNPAKQLGDARNAQRKADANAILNAIYQYMIDNNGMLPSGITTDPKEICKSSVATTTCAATLSVITDELTAGQKFLISIPEDPAATTTNGTGYYISKSVYGRVTVSALAVENGATISITR